MSATDDRKPPALKLVIDMAPDAEPLKQPEPAPKAGAGKSGTAKASKGEAAAGDGGGGQGEAPSWSTENLPPDCPVVPLGYEGRTRYYLDSEHQMIELTAAEHNRLNIMALFGHKTDFLYKHWPRLSQDKETKAWITTGWRPEAVAESLFAACARCGNWDLSNRVRGPGAWKGEDGRLVLHCGNVILTGTESIKPGFHNKYVYPSRAALPLPWPSTVPAGEDGPGRYIRSLLGTWNWKRGDLDATLMLGAIGCGMIGGALDWRPLTWLTGSSGVGKTTLRNLIKSVFGDRLIACEDPSPAGIWQKLRHATLPVSVDELEAEEGANHKSNAIIKLARMAANGAVMLRGGADHQGTEFTVRSTFIFLSILVPPLLAQDRNRMCILSLGPLRHEAAPDIEPAKLREVGQQLLRRLVDHWHEWPDVHARFHSALLAERMSARTADVYAALLTAAELIQHDDRGGLGDVAQGFALELARYHAGEAGEDMPDEMACLNYLLSSQIPLETGGTRRPVAEWCRIRAKNDPYDQAQHAKQVLMNYGMKVLDVGPAGAKRSCLAVAFANKELNKVFAGSHWQARSGTSGVWKQSLERLPAAERSGSAIYFNGGNSRAVLIPVELIFPQGDPRAAQTAADSDEAGAEVVAP